MTPPVVVIGASAGGTEALLELVAGLPADFPAAVFVVTHMPASADSRLPSILSRQGRLPASHPLNGEVFQAGHIYCALPDHHLLVEDTQIAVTKGPTENRFRPSIDALFRSAAYSQTSRVIGVILSGLLDDGTSGLWTIKRRGGRTVIQDLQDAIFDDMPSNALRYVEIDAVLPARDIAAHLGRLLEGMGPSEAPAIDDEWNRLALEVGVAHDGLGLQRDITHLGKPSNYACPECHGVLRQFDEGPRKRFRCHTGHAYTASALLAEITENAEHALWQGRRALEEAALLLDELGQGYEQRGEREAAQTFFEQARVEEARSLRLLDLLNRNEVLGENTLLGKV